MSNENSILRELLREDLDDASLSFVYIEEDEQEGGQQNQQEEEAEHLLLEEAEEEGELFYSILQPRSSTPLANAIGGRSATPSASSSTAAALHPQLDDFSSVTENGSANLEEITRDFDLFRLEGGGGNGLSNHDGYGDTDDGAHLDHQLRAFGHRMRMAGGGRGDNKSNTGGRNIPIGPPQQRQNVPAQQQTAPMPPPTTIAAPMPTQVAAPQEFMASIELCLFSGSPPLGSNPTADHADNLLYKDRHLVTWILPSGGCRPLLCQKVEQIVRQSGDLVMADVVGQNFERLDKRAWAKFTTTPAAGRQSQFHGQLFRVDYGSEQMKNETEYTVHLHLLQPPPNFVGPRRNPRIVCDNDGSFDDENVEEETFVVERAPMAGFTVWIMDLHGRNHRIDAMSGETKIGELKAMVAEKTGMPREQQRLIFLGKPIDGDEQRELASFNITKNATIHLAMRLKGGDHHHHHE